MPKTIRVQQFCNFTFNDGTGRAIKTTAPKEPCISYLMIAYINNHRTYTMLRLQATLH